MIQYKVEFELESTGPAFRMVSMQIRVVSLYMALTYADLLWFCLFCCCCKLCMT